MSPSGRLDSRYAKVLLNGGRGARTDETEAFARFRSLARASSSYGNFASNSASEVPNAVAIALFGAPNAIIARTKRRSASLNFEAPHLSAASASLSACTRGVIAFGFRPDPGLAPPRPIPLDFVISNPLNFWRSSGPLSSRDKSNCRTVAKSDSRWRALAPHGLAVLCLCRVAMRSSSIFRRATRSQTVQGLARITSRKREQESLSNRGIP